MASASPNRDRIVDAITAVHDQFEDNWDDLYAKCTTDDQRKHLADLRSAASDAFWKVQAAELLADNNIISSMVDGLNDAAKKVKDALDSLVKIDDFIKSADEAVKLATSLAKLAAG
jgi:hypothetical protein